MCRGEMNGPSETDVWDLLKKRFLNLNWVRGANTTVLTEEDRVSSTLGSQYVTEC